MPSAGKHLENIRTWMSVAINAPSFVLHMI
jgi:hypothetical protein